MDDAVVAKLVTLLHFHVKRDAHPHCLAEGCDSFAALTCCFTRHQEICIRGEVFAQSIDVSVVEGRAELLKALFNLKLALGFLLLNVGLLTGLFMLVFVLLALMALLLSQQGFA